MGEGGSVKEGTGGPQRGAPDHVEDGTARSWPVNGEAPMSGSGSATYKDEPASAGQSAGDLVAECNHLPGSIDGTRRAVSHHGPASNNAVNDLEALVEKRLQHIQLTQEITSIANGAESIHHGLHAALAAFCRMLDWCVGHALREALNEPGVYVDSGLWWLRDENRFEPLVEASRRLAFRAGDGFVGRVVDAGKPLWIGRELEDVFSERAEAARALGLCCGIGIPVLVESRVVGVLEFYSDKPRPCEPELLAAAAQVGIQLGRTVEREEFERLLARLSVEEHRRLGRELHDTLSQQLMGTAMLARSLEQKLRDGAHPDVERARSIVESISEARSQVRAIARGLDPMEIDKDTIVPALRGIAEDTQTAYGVRCVLRQAASWQVEDDFVANQLFLIAREAVHNAARHAEASTVTIELDTPPTGGISLCVRDDGQGFDARVASRKGMGLRILRHRARTIGARLRIETENGSGSSVKCWLKQGTRK